MFAAAAESPAKPTAEQVEFFEKRVRPVLLDRCIDCHGEDEAESKLRLNSLAEMLKGGTRGPAIVRGKPEKSLLIIAINHGELLQMPEKEKLPTREILDLTAWVKMGAPWPNAKLPNAKLPNAKLPTVAADSGQAGKREFTEEEKNFWAFRRVDPGQAPKVKDAGWVRSPIDRYVLARLEAKGLRPAPLADKRTLIRRATFDLTGLPTRPEEIKRFLDDTSAAAYENLIDRLLASPRYGERWGRHWLDVARYADSNGMDENLAFIQAFRYRDWVIKALNDDLPYDRFVHEQLAGDLLPKQESESAAAINGRRIATGFLSIGPKMLADDDPLKKEMDIIDEQISTVTKAFMGLTLECARCHDHKFDPLTMVDYYALAGIFKSTKTMNNFKVVAEWHEYDLNTSGAQKEYEAKLAELDRRIGDLLTAAGSEFRAAQQKLAGKYLAAAAEFLRLGGKLDETGGKPLGESVKPADLTGRGVLREAETFERGNVGRLTTGYGAGIGVILNVGPMPNFAEFDVDIAAAGDYQLELRYAAAEARPLRLSINGRAVKNNAASQVTGGWNPDRQKWFVEGTFSLTKGKNVVRLDRPDGPYPHVDKLLLVSVSGSKDGTKDGKLPRTTRELAGQFKLNEEVLKQWIRYLPAAQKAGGPLWQPLVAHQKKPDAQQSASLDALAVEYQKRFDASARSSAPTAVLKPFRSLLDAADGPLRLPKHPERFFHTEQSQQLTSLRSQRQQFAANKPRGGKAMGVTEGKVQNVRIHLRGSTLTLGREVRRQFPQIIAGDQKSPVDVKQSGRLQFAHWLTSPDHPLTSRVMINRIWRWHFGAGLVRTPDNFGRLGERPTHPRLLDWLAREFVLRKWSMKAMHREIMRSSTYRMSTAYDAKAAAADPENRLLWRFNRRRMEAEEVRDALLAMGGNLDLSLGGQLMKFKNRAYVTGTGSTLTSYNNNRRSVYQPVLRSAVYQVFQAFDFADPSVLNGRRATTTVTPQALFMMNSDLMSDNAGRMADALLARDELSDADRIALAYERGLGRPPSAAETARMIAFVEQIAKALRSKDISANQARQKAWRSLCRVVMASNEFIYIE
jgi:hypothetical protein